MNRPFALVVAVACSALSATTWAQSCPSGTVRVTGGTLANPNGPGNFDNFITGNTICAARGADRWQEFHQSDGALFDWKLGPGHAVDPRKQVGNWSATNGANATLTHTYNIYSPTVSFVWALCLPVNAVAPFTYTMVSPTGGTVSNVRILSGSTSCP